LTVVGTKVAAIHDPEAEPASKGRLQPDLPDDVILGLCPFSSMGMPCKVSSICPLQKLCTELDCACESVHGRATCRLAGRGKTCSDEDCDEGLHSAVRVRVAMTARKHHTELMKEKQEEAARKRKGKMIRESL